MSKDIVTVDCHSLTVVEKTIDEVKTTTHVNHTISKIRVDNAIDNGLMMDGSLGYGRSKGGGEAIMIVSAVVIEVIVNEFNCLAFLGVFFVFHLGRLRRLLG